MKPTQTVTAEDRPRYGLTPKARLYLAIRRLEQAGDLPDDVAERLAACITTIAREYGPAKPRARLPLLARVTA